MALSAVPPTKLFDPVHPTDALSVGMSPSHFLTSTSSRVAVASHSSKHPVAMNELDPGQVVYCEPTHVVEV